MQKKAVRNFVCSFLFSLLVVGTISKVCFRAPTEKPKLKDITPAHNISLFSNSNNGLGTSKDIPAIDVSAIDALSAEPSAKDQKVSDIEFSSIDEIPSLKQNVAEDVAAAEIANADEDVNEDTKNNDLNKINTDLASAQEIILEKENIITVAKQEKPYEKSGIVYSDISDTLKDEEAVETEKPVKLASVVYSPEGNPEEDIAQAKTIVTENNDTPNIVIASNNEPLTESEDIPLFTSSEVLHGHVEVEKSAHASEIAMLEPAHLVSNIESAEEPEEKTLAEADLKQNEWTQMSETKEESPWVVAKGNRFAKNKIAATQFAENDNISATEKDEDAQQLKEDSSEEQQKISSALNPSSENKAGKETKVAYQMIPNLLIPIPEDIANDPNLTPQLSVSPKENQKAEEAEKNLPEPEESEIAEKTLNDEEKQSGLFKNITSWFSNGKDTQPAGEVNNSAPQTQDKKSTFNFFGIGSSESQATEAKTQILPAELRLSFQPNRAEISGQTLNWIHAFADNARDNSDIYIEVRIDGTSSFALQRKRLNLLSTIFANRGVDFRKINIVFTSREPNSFIIRNIRFNNKEEVVVNQDNQNSYYRPW